MHIKHSQIQVIKNIYNYFQFFLLAKRFDTYQNYNKSKAKLLDIRQTSYKNKRKSPILVSLNATSNNSSRKNNNLIVKGNSFIDSPLLGNFNLQKRIIEKNSVYSISQWKKDFKKSRIYKKISCEYPSINFVAKPKNKMKQNYVFNPTKDFNIFNEVRFKPFESFEEEENSKGGKCKTISKRKRKRRRNILHKY